MREEKIVLEVEEGVDESREIGLPKDVMDKLGLKIGDTVAYEKTIKGVCIFKIDDE